MASISKLYPLAWLVVAILFAPAVARAFNQTDVDRLRASGVCERCDLSGFGFPRKSSLANTWLAGADLSGAKLQGADLRGANLAGADLRGAMLSDARLKGANLSGAKLGGAELRGVNLKRVMLHGADLSGAIGSDLSNAQYACNTTLPDGSTSAKGCRF
jgi:uncharacterized protein YjbI with pentapeptide repeats